MRPERGTPFSVIATHAPPPVSPDLLATRNRHLEQIAELAATTLGDGGVLLGDLNVTPWTPQYGRLLDVAALRDARRGFGILGTWPSFVPSGLALPLDHILVTGDLRVVDGLRGGRTGSDHRPLLTVLALPAAG